MTAKELKQYIGTEIGLLPTGNNVSRRTPQNTVVTAKLIKVGRSMATLESGIKFYIDGGLDNWNCGYYPFPTSKDAENHVKARNLERWLKDQRWDNVSLEDMQTIYRIITGETDE